MSSKKVFVAVTNDISTDYRVHKVCDYLVSKGFKVLVYGRVLPNTINVNRDYQIVRKKHLFNYDAWFYAEYNTRLFFYLLFRKFDFILANDLDTVPACFFASKLKSTKLVLDSHELFSEVPELQGRKFVQKFWKSLESFFLPKIKRAYTVSESIAEYYHTKHANAMGVIRNVPSKNIAYKKEEVSFPTTNKTILYQGVLNPGRGLKPMIKALHLLEGIDLIIIGYGKVEAELRLFVDDENLSDRVFFLGRIERHRLINYTKKATLGMVLEEPNGLSFKYSLPNKLFDYIHAELPIISGNLPEISKIITKYKVGVTVESYHPKDIAKCIKDLLKDPDKISLIKQNQKNAKEILCWENEQKKLDVYFK